MNIDTSNIPCIVFLVIIVIIISMYVSQGSSCGCMSYGPYNYEGFGAVTNSATDCKLLCDLAAAPGGTGCQAYSYIPSNTNNSCVFIPNMAAANVIPAVIPGATSNIISANKPASITSGNSYNNFITGVLIRLDSYSHLILKLVLSIVRLLAMQFQAVCRLHMTEQRICVLCILL